MSARGFPKCFPGSRPSIHVGHVRHTHACNSISHRNVKREEKRERKRKRGRSATFSVIEDDRLGGLQAAAHVNLHPGSICLTLQGVYTDLSG